MKEHQLNAKQLIAGIFFISLVVRIGFVLLYPQSAPDTISYDTIAINLTRGFGYTVDGSTAHVTRPPLYPFFLASLYLVFGHNFIVVRLVQALIDSITVIFIYKLGKTISGKEKIGIISALLACFYPELVAPTVFVLTETLATFLLTISMWLFIAGNKRGKISMSMGGGILLGLATLCRPMTLLLPIFLFIGLLFAHRKTWIICWASFSLAMMVTIAPWTIRNYIAFKTFIPVTVGVGHNLWTGSYIPWDGDYNFKDLSDWTKIKQGLSEIEADKKLKEEALRNISSAPMTYLLLCGKKFMRFWFGIPGSKQLLIGKPVVMAFLYIFHYITLVLFIIGFSTQQGNTSQGRWIAMTTIVYTTVLHSILFPIPRYRIPIIPLVLVFAGSGLVRLFPQLLHSLDRKIHL